MLDNAVVQSPLNRQILGYRFDNPVAVLYFLDILVETARRDQPGVRWDEERRGTSFHRCIETGARNPRIQIQQQRRNPGVRQMSGNAGTHCSRSKDSDAAYRLHQRVPNRSLPRALCSKVRATVPVSNPNAPGWFPQPAFARLCQPRPPWRPETA